MCCLVSSHFFYAEVYAAGELKHGPIALIDKTFPLVIMPPNDALFEKTISNMQEVMARHGQVALHTDAESAIWAGEVQNVIVLPKVADAVAPPAYPVPAQILAHSIAIARGAEFHQP